MRIPWRPAQSAEPEWMDRPGHPPEIIAENLRDLERVNRLLGGVRLTLRPLARLLSGRPAQEPVRILDVASGGADIARAMAGWARGQGRTVAIVASDISYDFLLVARDRSQAYPNLAFVVADARRLPFGDGSVHVATCSLALHHLSPDDGVLMLREMGRCATVGVIVNDIVRSWLGYGGAYVATRLGSRNPLTWHDGPVSVLRAFTTAEMAQLARRAGLRPVRWDCFLLYRVAMTAVACGRP